MNKTSSKVIQISDLVQWAAKGEIELSPKYQRNSVWNDNAKAYLIDTIVRGLPMWYDPPKVDKANNQIYFRRIFYVQKKKIFTQRKDKNS